MFKERDHIFHGNSFLKENIWNEKKMKWKFKILIIWKNWKIEGKRNKTHVLWKKKNKAEKNNKQKPKKIKKIKNEEEFS